MLVTKLDYRSKIYILEGFPTSLADLHEKACEKYKTIQKKGLKNFLFFYFDFENDKILIDSDKDLKILKENSRSSVKIYVIEKERFAEVEPSLNVSRINYTNANQSNMDDIFDALNDQKSEQKAAVIPSSLYQNTQKKEAEPLNNFYNFKKTSDNDPASLFESQQVVQPEPNSTAKKQEEQGCETTVQNEEGDKIPESQINALDLEDLTIAVKINKELGQKNEEQPEKNVEQGAPELEQNKSENKIESEQENIIQSPEPQKEVDKDKKPEQEASEAALVGKDKKDKPRSAPTVVLQEYVSGKLDEIAKVIAELLSTEELDLEGQNDDAEPEEQLIKPAAKDEKAEDKPQAQKSEENIFESVYQQPMPNEDEVLKKKPSGFLLNIRQNVKRVPEFISEQLPYIYLQFTVENKGDAASPDKSRLSQPDPQFSINCPPLPSINPNGSSTVVATVKSPKKCGNYILIFHVEIYREDLKEWVIASEGVEVAINISQAEEASLKNYSAIEIEKAKLIKDVLGGNFKDYLDAVKNNPNKTVNDLIILITSND